MMMPSKAKSVCQGNQQDNGQNGIIPSAVEKPRLDPYPQGDQDDKRIESRKQAKLHTGQQPHQKHWNNRQGCPNHGYQACQSASQRQERRVWRPEQPVTKAQQQPGQETVDYLAADVSADVRLDCPPNTTRLFALPGWKQREPESFKMNLIDAPIDAQEQNDEYTAHDAANTLREAE